MKRMIAGVVAVCALSAVGAGTASIQDVRTVAFNDPQDALVALSGPPNPDVRSASVTYDTAGQVTASVTFYAPVVSRELGFAVGFSLGNKLNNIAAGWDTCSTDGASADGVVSIKPDGEAAGNFTMSGTTGLLAASASHNADSTTYTAVFTNGALANQNWTCAGVDGLIVIYYSYSWCTDPGCPIDSTGLDAVNQAAWFPGHSPVPPKPVDVKAYWRITANHDYGPGMIGLVVRNAKVASSLDYKACLWIRSGARRCQASTLFAGEPDELPFVSDNRLLRPLRVSIYVKGKLQLTKRVAIH